MPSRLGFWQVVVGDDEVEAEGFGGFGGGEGADAGVDADDEADTFAGGDFEDLVAHAVAFAQAVRDVEADFAAAAFDGGFEQDDGGGAIYVVVAVDEDRLADVRWLVGCAGRRRTCRTLNMGRAGGRGGMEEALGFVLVRTPRAVSNSATMSGGMLASRARDSAAAAGSRRVQRLRAALRRPCRWQRCLTLFVFIVFSLEDILPKSSRDSRSCW